MTIQRGTHLQGLRQHADDPAFQQKWRDVKLAAKEKAAKKIEALTGVKVNPNAMLDIQIKRIHEYKRQLLNVLGIVYRYDQMKKMTPEQRKQVCSTASDCAGCSAVPATKPTILGGQCVRNVAT